MKYEVMAIIANHLDEKDAQAHIQNSIVKFITEFEGKMTFEDFWGARGFAYKIKKQTWGYYYVAQFEIDGTKLAEIKKELSIDTKIIRTLFTKVDSKAAEPRKYADLKAEYEAQEKKKDKDSEEAPKTSDKKEKLTTVNTSKTPAKDAVDKKLDAIIDESTANI